MRIGLISTYMSACPPLDYGGESYYWGLAKTLGEMGHEVHLVAPGGSQTPPNGYLHTIKGSKSIDYGIEEWVEKTYHDILMEIDVIHDCSLDHITAERLKNFYGKTNIVNTINGSTYWMPRPPFNVVTGSKAWQEDAQRHGLKTEMVYWGVDIDFYMPLEKKRKDDYFLWISRFHPDKGLDDVLDIAEILGFKLKVAGSLSLKDHAHYGQVYQERIKNLPNVEYVSLPLDSQHHIKKRELYQKARALLYPVKYFECFGLVVMEAQACGCPVIAYKNGSMSELVDHNKTGFLCKTKAEFAQIIQKDLPYFEQNMVNHKGFNLYENAREKALNFTWLHATKRYLTLYEKVQKGESW